MRFTEPLAELPTDDDLDTGNFTPSKLKENEILEEAKKQQREFDAEAPAMTGSSAIPTDKEVTTEARISSAFDVEDEGVESPAPASGVDAEEQARREQQQTQQTRTAPDHTTSTMTKLTANDKRYLSGKPSRKLKKIMSTSPELKATHTELQDLGGITLTARGYTNLAKFQADVNSGAIFVQYPEMYDPNVLMDSYKKVKEGDESKIALAPPEVKQFRSQYKDLESNIPLPIRGVATGFVKGGYNSLVDVWNLIAPGETYDFKKKKYKNGYETIGGVLTIVAELAVAGPILKGVQLGAKAGAVAKSANFGYTAIKESVLLANVNPFELSEHTTPKELLDVTGVNQAEESIGWVADVINRWDDALLSFDNGDKTTFNAKMKHIAIELSDAFMMKGLALPLIKGIKAVKQISQAGKVAKDLNPRVPTHSPKEIEAVLDSLATSNQEARVVKRQHDIDMQKMANVETKTDEILAKMEMDTRQIADFGATPTPTPNPSSSTTSSTKVGVDGIDGAKKPTPAQQVAMSRELATTTLVEAKKLVEETYDIQTILQKGDDILEMGLDQMLDIGKEEADTLIKRTKQLYPHLSDNLAEVKGTSAVGVLFGTIQDKKHIHLHNSSKGIASLPLSEITDKVAKEYEKTLSDYISVGMKMSFVAGAKTNPASNALFGKFKSKKAFKSLLTEMTSDSRNALRRLTNSPDEAFKVSSLGSNDTKRLIKKVLGVGETGGKTKVASEKLKKQAIKLGVDTDELLLLKQIMSGYKSTTNQVFLDLTAKLVQQAEKHPDAIAETSTLAHLLQQTRISSKQDSILKGAEWEASKMVDVHDYLAGIGKLPAEQRNTLYKQVAEMVVSGERISDLGKLKEKSTLSHISTMLSTAIPAGVISGLPTATMNLASGYFNIALGTAERVLSTTFSKMFSKSARHALADNIHWDSNVQTYASDLAFTTSYVRESVRSFWDLFTGIGRGDIGTIMDGKISKSISSTKIQDVGQESSKLTSRLGMSTGLEVSRSRKEKVIENMYTTFDKINRFTLAPTKSIDNLVKTPVEQATAYASIYQSLQNHGLSGGDVGSYAKDLHAKLRAGADSLNGTWDKKHEIFLFDDETLKKAQLEGIKAGQEVIFNSTPNKLTRGVLDAKRYINNMTSWSGIPLGTIMFPVISTPIQVITRVYDYSPMAFLHGIPKRGTKEGNDMLARATIGSGLMMMGFQMASTGSIVSGSSDTQDPKLRSYYKALGINRPSLVIDGKAHALEPLGSIGEMFSFISAISDVNKYYDEKTLDPETKEMYNTGITYMYMKSLTNAVLGDMPMTKSIQAIADITSARGDNFNKDLRLVDKGFQSFVGTAVAGVVVPRIVETALDTVRYVIGGEVHEQTTDSFIEDLKARVGFDIRPRRDVWGNPIDLRTNPDHYNNIFSKFTLLNQKETADEIFRTGASFSRIRKVKGMSADEYDELQQILTEDVDLLGRIKQLIGSHFYKEVGSNVSMKGAMIEKIRSTAHKSARDIFARRKADRELIEAERRIEEFKKSPEGQNIEKFRVDNNIPPFAKQNTRWNTLINKI